MKCRLALIAALALVAAACGAHAADDQSVAAAAEATQAAGSARLETITRSTFDSQEYVVRTTGVVDYANDRLEEVTSYPAAGDSSPQSAHLIIVKTVSWLEIPDSEVVPPAGKRWRRFDPAGAEALVEESAESPLSDDGSGSEILPFTWTTSGGSRDGFLDYLQGVGPDPEEVGEERVRGVETTRYRTQLDVPRAVRRDLERDGSAERNIERALEGMEGKYEIDVWIGADGLIRRIVWRNEPAGDPSLSSETTTEFFDFGVETDIQPRPPGEVMEQEEWLGMMQAEQKKWLEENQVVGESP